MELKLDDAGVAVISAPPSTPNGDKQQEMELRVKRAKIGLGVSAGIYALGLGMSLAGATGDCGYIYWGYANPPSRCDPLLIGGTVISIFGLAGMITSGVLLRRNKRDRDSLERADHGAPRRARWNPAESALAF